MNTPSTSSGYSFTTSIDSRYNDAAYASSRGDYNKSAPDAASDSQLYCAFRCDAISWKYYASPSKDYDVSLEIMTFFVFAQAICILIQLFHVISLCGKTMKKSKLK